MMKNKKINPNQKKILKWLKLVMVLCILIVVLELAYIGITYYKNKSKKVYVDTLSTMTKVSDGYLVAGNSDFKYSEFNKYQDKNKAKFTKYDKNFKVVFESNYTRGYKSFFNNIAEYSDGYIAVGGAEFTKQQIDDNATDGIIVRYDKNGKYKDYKRIQIAGDTTFTKVLVVDDGFIVIGQSILQNMVIGSNDKGGALIIKYDFDMNEVWKHNYGGSKSAIYNDILMDDGYLYLVGKDATRYGVIAKYTLDGEMVFAKSYEYTDTVGFSSIVKYQDDFIVAGSKTINIDAKDGEKVTKANLVRYNSDGDKIKDVSFTANSQARFNKVVVDGDKIVAIGHTSIKDKKESTDTYNVFRYSGIMAIYDGNLKKVESHIEKGSRDNYFSDILIQKDGYLIGGSTSSKELGGNNKDFRTYFLKYDKDLKKVWYK